MNDMTVILQGLLMLLFVGSGGMKLALPYERFIQMPFQGWAMDFRPVHIRAIGLGEVAAAITMAAFTVVSSLPDLAGTAAVAMALVMSGATATHLRRSEYLNIVGNLVWLGLALLVAYQRLVCAG